MDTESIVLAKTTTVIITTTPRTIIATLYTCLFKTSPTAGGARDCVYILYYSEGRGNKAPKPVFTILFKPASEAIYDSQFSLYNCTNTVCISNKAFSKLDINNIGLVSYYNLRNFFIRQDLIFESRPVADNTGL